MIFLEDGRQTENVHREMSLTEVSNPITWPPQIEIRLDNKQDCIWVPESMSRSLFSEVGMLKELVKAWYTIVKPNRSPIISYNMKQV